MISTAPSRRAEYILTYGDIAHRLGEPRSAQAVGQARSIEGALADEPTLF